MTLKKSFFLTGNFIPRGQLNKKEREKESFLARTLVLDRNCFSDGIGFAGKKSYGRMHFKISAQKFALSFSCDMPRCHGRLATSNPFAAEKKKVITRINSATKNIFFGILQILVAQNVNILSPEAVCKICLFFLEREKNSFQLDARLIEGRKCFS